MTICLLVFYLLKFRSETGNRMDYQQILLVLIMEFSSLTVEDGLSLSILKDKLINGSETCIKIVTCILLN